MLLENIKNITSTKKDLKKIGFIFGAIFIFIGGLLYQKNQVAGLCFLIIGISFALLGKFTPFFLKSFYEIWTVWTLIISWIVTHLVLGIIFYMVVTPIGFIIRISGKKLLDLKVDRSSKSYWGYKEKFGKAFNKEYYEKQF